jgi:hypothetical protein
LAKVVVEYAKSRGGNSKESRLPEEQDFVFIIGHVVNARVYNKNILVGNVLYKEKK